MLRGCPIGRLVQDQEILADPTLLEPIAAVFTSSLARMTEVLREAQEAGEVRADVDPEQVAVTLLAVIQGGYVVARAHQDEDRFAVAIDGVLSLIAVVR